jgi:hypothetical protein
VWGDPQISISTAFLDCNSILGAAHKNRHPKKTVFIYLGGEGFEGHLFKKSVDLEKSKLTILSEKNS